MTTREDLVEELISRLMVADNSTVWTPQRCQSLINDAHTWATSMFFWPQLNRAMKTVMVEGDSDYFDYPSIYRTNSIARLTLNGKRYSKKNFDDLLEWRDANPTSTRESIYADYARQYFIYPAPSIGDEIIVWGNIMAPHLSTDTSTTIFSDSDEAGNEAIVRKAFSVGIRRFDPNLAEAEKNEAGGVLAGIWKRIKDREQLNQKLDRPFFDVSDMYATTTPTIGNFNYGGR